MSSHREAPAISKDPVADNTDTYAFVSPDDPSTVTIIANYLPLEAPFGGPNFFEFGDDVLLRASTSTTTATASRRSPTSSSSRPRSATRTRSSTTPARSTRSTAANWNRRQFYTVTRVKNGQRKVLGERPGLPAVQHRPGLDPELRDAGQRGDPLRRRAGTPCSRASGSRASTSTSARSSTSATCARFRSRHIVAMARATAGVNATARLQRALDRAQGPEVGADARRLGADRRRTTASSVIGVWAAASRRNVR